MKIKQKMTTDLYDVFRVRQLTRHTTLEHQVAVDMVYLPPNQTSRKHRHNKSDTILLIVSGKARIGVNKAVLDVTKGERIHIPPGALHYVQTGRHGVRFLSIQTPPILSRGDDRLDLEYEPKKARRP